jgi:hypothetical protein
LEIERQKGRKAKGRTEVEWVEVTMMTVEREEREVKWSRVGLGTSSSLGKVVPW